MANLFDSFCWQCIPDFPSTYPNIWSPDPCGWSCKPGRMTYFVENYATNRIESIKTTSTGKKKRKMMWCIKTYIIAYVRTQKIRFIIHYVKPTAQLLFSPGTYRTWWGAASPILNDTPVVYTTYNRTFIRNVRTYIYTYISTQSYWTGTKVIRRKHIVQPTGFGACSSTCCQWDGEDVPAPWEWSNSHPPVRVQISCVNPFI